MNICEFIEKSDNETPLLVTTHITLSATDLKTKITKHTPVLHPLIGKNVAIEFHSNFELAQWLIFLDGIANRITLLPSNTDEITRNTFLKLTESTHIITDHTISSCPIHTQNIFELPTSTPSKKTINRTTQTEWVLTTSGTTATPKLVKHTLNSLLTTAKKTKTSTKNTWGLLYNLQRFAGLQVYLQALLSNNTLVITEDTQTLTEKIDLLSKQKVNCLSATPTLWRKLLMQPNFKQLALKTVTLGGEIADANILNALSTRFPHAKIRHIYASTEAGAGFSVIDGQPGFPEHYLKDGITGISLKISTKNTLLIKSNAKSSGYIGDIKLAENDGYIDTGDLISHTNNRYYFDGRHNGAINIGGNKVQPEQIESVILAFQNVIMTSVIAKKSPIMGNLIQANLVINKAIEDKKAFISELRKHCKANLETIMVPALFKIVEDIELNATGKIQKNE